jgi:hypothetical protein
VEEYFINLQKISRCMGMESNIKKAYALALLSGLFFVGGVTVPFFTDWGKISLGQVMFLQAFFVICAFILEVPSGALADKIGRKKTLVLACIADVVAPIVYSSYPNFFVFMAGEFVFAVGSAMASGTIEAIIYDSIKQSGREKDSKKIFSNLGSIQLLSMAIAFIIGAALAQAIGLQQVMMLSALPFFGALIVAMTFKEPHIRAKQKKYFQILGGGIKYFLRHKVLKALTFDRISIAVLVFPIFILYQQLLLDFGQPLISLGIVATLIALVQAGATNKLETLEKIAGGKKRYLLFSALASGICFLILAFTKNWIIGIALMLIIAALGSTRSILFMNYANKHIKSHNRATVISIISMIERVIQGIAYVALGYLVGWNISYTMVILGVLILAASLISRVKEEHLID